MDYSHWSDQDWARVLWSDEKYFYLNYVGREYVNCPIGQSRDPKYIRPIDKLEGKVSIWGCICAEGLGHAELYAGDLNAAAYQHILSLNLKRSAGVFFPKGQWWFQQDNASPHTSGTTSA